MTATGTWLYYALGSAFFAALTAIFGKIGVSKIPSDLATFLRTVLILGVTALVVTLRSEWRDPRGLDTAAMWALAASAVATGLSWLCYYQALALAPASKVAPVDKLSLAFVVVLSVAILGETLVWKTLLGAALVVAGAVVIAL